MRWHAIAGDCIVTASEIFNAERIETIPSGRYTKLVIYGQSSTTTTTLDSLDDGARIAYQMIAGRQADREIWRKQRQAYAEETKGLKEEIRKLTDTIESTPQVQEQRARQAEARRIREAREAAEHEAYMRRPEVMEARRRQVEKDRIERERNYENNSASAAIGVFGFGSFMSGMIALCTSFQTKTPVCSTASLAAFIIGEAITLGLAYKIYKW